MERWKSHKVKLSTWFLLSLWKGYPEFKHAMCKVLAFIIGETLLHEL